MSGRYRLVASAINHPDAVHPTWGVFNRRSLQALSRQDVDLEAVVPRPYAPPVGPYSSYSKVPDEWDAGEYLAHHPRFLYALPKRWLYGITGRSVRKNVSRYVNRTLDRPDVVHGAHLYPDGYAMKAVAETYDVPLTTVAHGTLINQFDSYPRSVRNAVRSVLAESDRVLCVSDALVDRVQTIATAANAEVLPLGATPENFPTERSAMLRRELNVPADATVVVYCGHFSEEKGVPDLADALRVQTDDRLYVVCIGHGGSLRWELERTIHEIDVPGRVLWKVDPVVVRRWFALADALVLPSYDEGRPTVIYEAMASATPVIATTVGGIPEQVVDGETGWLFEPGDTDVLMNLLDSLDREVLDTFGDRALERLHEKGWTWERHGNALAAVHEELLRERT